MEERERLENTLESTIEGKTATQKRVWEAEDKLRERVQALEDSGRNYYAVAEDLKLVPKTARNAHNRDLTIEIDIRYDI
jgi:predicted  nucleic acid-binding Zn-ribbon protein